MISFEKKITFPASYIFTAGSGTKREMIENIYFYFIGFRYKYSGIFGITYTYMQALIIIVIEAIFRMHDSLLSNLIEKLYRV